jgi:hypothetical protein
MLRRQRRGDGGRRIADERDAFLRRDVLENDTKPRKVADDLPQVAVDKNLFAVEDIDIGIGHFAVERQHDAMFFHRRQRRIHVLHRRHTGIGMRRRARRVILDRVHEARFARFRDVGRRGPIGQIQRHQRFEPFTGGQRR